YGDMLKTLIAEADQSLVYYYDLSFDETLRRHAHRAKAKEFGADVMRDWYLPHDRLNVPTEQLISADWSQTMVINHILTDLAGLNNTESVKRIH
ncbi:MAG: kinase, partial [Lacticaseibacillus paracasei]